VNNIFVTKFLAEKRKRSPKQSPIITSITYKYGRVLKVVYHG
jgi:hypothetical protein